MALEQQENRHGKYKQYQINRIEKLLLKLKRPYSFNAETLGQRSRTNLTKIIKNLKMELCLM